MSDLQPNEERATVPIFEDDGAVCMQLPGCYVKLTPAQARKMAAALFTKAARAEGLEAPTMVLLPSN